jgi:hypothetical protein
MHRHVGMGAKRHSIVNGSQGSVLAQDEEGTQRHGSFDGWALRGGDGSPVLFRNDRTPCRSATLQQGQEPVQEQDAGLKTLLIGSLRTRR